MFCPNCGTQNEETAATCAKCGFNLKASAPKFKGTMLMVNSPVAGVQPPAPAAPVAPPAPAPAPAPAAPGPQSAAAAARALRGTVVGIAPPAAGGYNPPAPVAPAPAPAPMALPEQQGEAAHAHAKPHQPVNPFAGTMIGTAPPPTGFPGYPGAGAPGAPPAGQSDAMARTDPPPAPPADPFAANQYGPPPQVPTPVAAPAPNFAPMPTPAPMAAPTPAPMMAPPGPAAMVPAGPAPMMPPPQGGSALAGPPGELRNPMTVALISWLTAPICGAGVFYGMHQLRTIEGELHVMLGHKEKEGNILWYLFALIPLLSMPKLIAEARARVGTQTQGEPGLLGYLFLGVYLITKDATEIFQTARARQG